MPRLSDAYTDGVLTQLEQWCDQLGRATCGTWQRLIAAGRTLGCGRGVNADCFTRAVVLAVIHDRAVLLTFAWQRISQQVHQQMCIAPDRVPLAARGATPVARSLTVRTPQPPQMHPEQEGAFSQTDAATALVALEAAVLAVVMADLLDPETLERLAGPARPVLDGCPARIVRGPAHGLPAP